MPSGRKKGLGIRDWGLVGRKPKPDGISWTDVRPSRLPSSLIPNPQSLIPPLQNTPFYHTRGYRGEGNSSGPNRSPGRTRYPRRNSSISIRREPAGWTARNWTAPRAAAIVNRPSAASRTVPGGCGTVGWHRRLASAPRQHWRDASATNSDHRRRAEDQPRRRAVRAMPKCIRLRPRVHRANLISDRLGRAVPIDQSVGLFQSRGLRGQGRVLRQGRDPPELKIIDHAADQFRPGVGQPRLQLPRRFLGEDGDAKLGDARPGVELRRHVDDRHAGLGLAVVDGPLDRGRPAILRQERGVQVDASAAGGGERLRGEDLAVVADDQQIGRKSRQPGLLRRPCWRLPDRGSACCAARRFPATRSAAGLFGRDGSARAQSPGPPFRGASRKAFGKSAPRTAPCPS